MDNNMNDGSQMASNQQMDPNQQMYGEQQTDPNQQMYNGQMYGGQMYGGQQTDPNQQMYNGQMYGGQQMYNGQQTDPNQQMYNGQPGAPAGEKKSINLGEHKTVILGVVVAVVALVLIVSLFRGLLGHGKQSPKAVAKAVAKAVENEKPKQIYKLYDKKYLDYMMDEYDYDKDDVLDEIEDEIDSFVEDAEDWYDVGKIKRIKVDIEDVDKEKGKSLDEAKESMKDEMDIRVSQVATVEMEWEVIGKDDDYTADAEVYVYKRMGKWYLVAWYAY